MVVVHGNRYTAMVDRHVAAMAACLQDSHPMVRRHAILLISQLLLQVPFVYRNGW